MLILEGREGVRHHFHELERSATVVVFSAERIDETKEGTPEILDVDRLSICNC